MYRVILASESPRRKEIMEQMGIPFQAMGSSKAEVAAEKEPAAMVQALAALKAKDIASKIAEPKDTAADTIIIGADTMVFFRGNALGKPKDKVDAVRMLQMLSDEEHEVYTGVNIIIHPAKGNFKSISFAVCTKVLVRALTREQIENYVATGEPMDKAGAYAIQGKFGIYIKGIHGDYYNIVGFPIAKIHEKLLEQGIDLLNI